MTEHLLKVPPPVPDRAIGAVSTETAGAHIVDPSDPNADLERGFRYVYVRQPDGSEKRLYCDTVGLFIALEQGRVVEAEARAEAEAARAGAEARLAELQAELARLRGEQK